MKRALFIFAGTCWLLFALGFAWFLLSFFSPGGSFFGFSISSASVLLGMAQVLGFLAAITLCFAIGIVLFIRGALPAKK